MLAGGRSLDEARAASRRYGAWQVYRRDGYLSKKASGSPIGGLLIGAVAFIFLFGLSFGDWWPLFLIIVGFGTLLKRR